MSRAAAASIPSACLGPLSRLAAGWLRAGLLGGALALTVASGCTSIVPESEVAGALHRYSQGQAPGFSVAGAEIRIERVRFSRVLVKPEGGGYTAVATADAEARVTGGPAISYLGVERVPFVFEGRTARPRGALLPALAQLVEVMRRKNEALAAGDAQALEGLMAQRWEDPTHTREALLAAVGRRGPARVDPPSRWIVRIEREGAEVLEEGPPQPDGRAARTRFRLVRERGGFRFSSGLR